MLDSLKSLFSAAALGFISQRYCYFGQTELVGLYIISDLLLALACYAIAIAVLYIIRKRDDIPFHWIFSIIVIFFIASGSTHFVEVWTLWHPQYYLLSFIKAIAAGISLFVLLRLWLLVPKVLVLPNLVQLETTNQQLQREITERLPIEEAFKQNYNLLYAVIEVLPDFVFVKDIQGRYVTINSSHAQFIGKSREEIIGKTDAELWPPPIARQFRGKDLEIITTGIAETFEQEIINNQGLIQTKETTKSPWRDAQGNIIGIIGISRDISDRKQQEAALRQSEERFRKLFEAGPLGMALVDSDYRFIKANSMLCSLLGYTESELMTLKATDLTHPDDLTQNLQLVHQVETQERPYYQLEKRYIKKNKEVIWASITSNAIRDEDGTLLYYLGIIEDISERKQGEETLKQQKELLQTIFDHIPVMLALFDATGQLKMVNREWESILGWSLAEIQDRDVMAEFYPDPEYRQFVLNSIAATDGQWRDFKTTVQDGRVLDTSWANVRLSDGSIIGIGQDITARKRTEEALRLADFSFECLSLPAVWIRSDARILRVNQAACQSLGYSKLELESMHVYDLDPDFPVAVWSEHWQVLREQKTMTFITKHRTKDGRILPVEVTVNYVECDGQEYNFSFSRDISDRLQAESALRENQQLLQKIVDNSPASIYLIDAQNRHLLVNRCYEKLTGKSREQLIGKSIFELWPHEVAASHAANNQQVLSSGTVIETEEVAPDSDGIRTYISLKFPLHDANGSPHAVCGISTDITERKLAEAALHQANEQLICLVKKLESRNQEMTQLVKMSDILQTCLTVEEAYHVIPQLVQPMFPQVEGEVFILNRSKNLMEPIATWGKPFTSWSSFAPHNCLALKQSRAHWVEDVGKGVLCQHLHHPLATQVLCIPMVVHGEVTGLLYLSSKIPGQITEAKQQLAVAVAEQLALALVNLKLRETLEYERIHDSLTGLFNRRFLEESLAKELHQAAHRKYPLGIIMLDIDYFKRFNDQFGHAGGDAVLRELGRLLKASIRSSDLACRYGGEELTLILPGAGMEAAYQRAELLRLGAKQLQVQHDGRHLGCITLSLGVACFPEHGSTGDALLEAADAALYQAKAEGRDRTVVHTG